MDLNQIGPDTTLTVTSPSHSNSTTPPLNQYAPVDLSSCHDVFCGQVHTDEHIDMFNPGAEAGMLSTAANFNTGINYYQDPQGHSTYNSNLFSSLKYAHGGEVPTNVPHGNRFEVPSGSSEDPGVISPTSTVTAANFNIGMNDYHVPRGHSTYDPNLFHSHNYDGEAPTYLPHNDSFEIPSALSEAPGIIVPMATGTVFPLVSNNNAPPNFEPSTPTSMLIDPAVAYTQSSPNHHVDIYGMSGASTHYQPVTYSASRGDSCSSVAKELYTSNSMTSMSYHSQNIPGSETSRQIASNDKMQHHYLQPYLSYEGSSELLEYNQPGYPTATVEPTGRLSQARNTTTTPMCKTVSVSPSLTSYPYEHTDSSLLPEQSSLCPISLVQSLSVEQKQSLLKSLQNDPDLQNVQGTKGSTQSQETNAIQTTALQSFSESELNTGNTGNSIAIASWDRNTENRSSSTFISQAHMESHPPQDFVTRTHTQPSEHHAPNETTPTSSLFQQADDSDLTPQDATKGNSNPLFPAFSRTSDTHITGSQLPCHQKQCQVTSATSERSSSPFSGRVSHSPVQAGERTSDSRLGSSKAENLPSNTVINVNNSISSVSQPAIEASRNYLHSISEDTSVLSSITSTSSLNEDQAMLSSISSRGASSGIGSLTYSLPLRKRSSSAVVNDEALSELLASGMKGTFVFSLLE